MGLAVTSDVDARRWVGMVCSLARLLVSVGCGVSLLRPYSKAGGVQPRDTSCTLSWYIFWLFRYGTRTVI